MNTPLGGELPISQSPVLTFTSLLTSVTATSTGDFTVAFLGTAEGSLKKAVVESSKSGLEYADIPIAPGTAVRSELLFDLKRDHVYVMTDRRLSKVKVQDCEQFTDCNQCLGARDPYCGWCSLENKCRSVTVILIAVPNSTYLVIDLHHVKTCGCVISKFLLKI